MESNNDKIEFDKNEIVITIKIDRNNVGKCIYFLDNTNKKYKEKSGLISHFHNNLKEITENNTRLFINDKEETYKKFFN